MHQRASIASTTRIYIGVQQRLLWLGCIPALPVDAPLSTFRMHVAGSPGLLLDRWQRSTSTHSWTIYAAPHLRPCSTFTNTLTSVAWSYDGPIVRFQQDTPSRVTDSLSRDTTLLLLSRLTVASLNRATTLNNLSPSPFTCSSLRERRVAEAVPVPAVHAVPVCSRAAVSRISVSVCVDLDSFSLQLFSAVFADSVCPDHFSSSAQTACSE